MSGITTGMSASGPRALASLAVGMRMMRGEVKVVMGMGKVGRMVAGAAAGSLQEQQAGRTAPTGKGVRAAVAEGMKGTGAGAMRGTERTGRHGKETGTGTETGLGMSGMTVQRGAAAGRVTATGVGAAGGRKAAGVTGTGTGTGADTSARSAVETVTGAEIPRLILWRFNHFLAAANTL
jgi:hypothetical protein